jgi:hypothetical protein
MHSESAVASGVFERRLSGNQEKRRWNGKVVKEARTK